MISLSTRGIPRGISANLLGKVTFEPVPLAARRDLVRVVASEKVEEDSLAGYLAVLAPGSTASRGSDVPTVSGCDVSHLGTGDIVSIDRSGHIRTVFRRKSQHNALFATDRCNSYCVMCSQPPRDVEDDWRADELAKTISLIDSSPESLGITGGEPTLLGAGLLRVVRACRDHLPDTSVHILTNGRRFARSEYATAFGEVSHPRLTLGVPVYSDIDSLHDHVVQVRGAFGETLRGLHNLADANINIEIRVVIHRHTYSRLPQLARFIYRNLTFAGHVALMGLEVIGFAKANIRELWIDPADYIEELSEAVEFLDTVGMNVSIYNHQLCTLPRSLWRFSRQSISDWKNEFAEACAGCEAREQCGGFFAWNLNGFQSRALAPIRL